MEDWLFLKTFEKRELIIVFLFLTVFSQSRLCTEAMFQFLFCQLPNEHSSVQMKRTTTFLIMCLVTNNGTCNIIFPLRNCTELCNLLILHTDMVAIFCVGSFAKPEGTKTARVHHSGRK